MEITFNFWQWLALNWRSLYAGVTVMTTIGSIWGLDKETLDRVSETLAAMNGAVGVIVLKSMADNVSGAKLNIANANALSDTAQAAAASAQAVITATAAAPTAQVIHTVAADGIGAAQSLLAAAERINSNLMNNKELPR